LIVAGDVYDGEWRDTSIGLFFNRQVSRLIREGIRVYTVRGNHDAASVVTKSVRLPEGVYEFSSRSTDTVLLDDLKVALSGRSFPDRAVPENYAASYPPARLGWFNIGVLHTSCDGRPGHDSYAPCSLDDLVSKGYQYWALGHVHAFELLHSDPHIIYPGNLQGRGVHECGAKGAVLVKVDGDEVSVERIIVDRARWFDLAIDLHAMSHFSEIYDRLGILIQPLVMDAEADGESRLLLVRIRLQGSTNLHATLHASKEDLRDELQSTLQHYGQEIWLEQLRIETAEPVQIEAQAGLSTDAFDLRSTLDTIVSTGVLETEAKQLAADIVRKLPAGASEETIFGEFNVESLIVDARGLLLERSGAAERVNKFETGCVRV
jgi:DNA repair exonuclease SbcCD nuclease subunit